MLKITLGDAKMDNYKEQLVKKGKDPSDTMKRLLVTLGGILVAAILVVLSIQFLGNFLVGLVLAGVALWGTYYIIGGFYTEYEYIFTNGDLDVDKIMGQRKRKRLITVELKTATVFDKAENAEEANRAIVDVSYRQSDCNYYIDFNHKDLGNARMIFTPNEEMIEIINHSLPRSVKRV